MKAQRAESVHATGGMTEKRHAIADAARAVFAREGYTRASVDTIATEAEVSKRTVYNHYRDKEELFLLTIQESAAGVATAQEKMIEKHLVEVTDLEADLLAFAHDWVSPMPGFEDHFALVRTIIAEAARLPREVLDGWQDVGPRYVRKVLTRHLRRLADEGWLVVDDETTATRQLIQLVSSEANQRSFHGALPLATSEINTLVTEGVHAFLRLYAASPTATSP